MKMLKANGQKELHKGLLSSISLWNSVKWRYFASTIERVLEMKEDGPW
jgi:hypothetical protein